MDLQKYLPVGSIVMLKGGKHRLMITGFCTVDFEANSKVYDYSGCFYPEGFISFENIIMFNHVDIEKIFYLGLSDDEEKQFKVELMKTIETSVDENGNLKN